MTTDPTTQYLENILGDNHEAKLAVREIPPFKNCSHALLGLVFKYGRIFALREGEELTREGEFDQWVFFIIAGRLAVFVGEERVDTISSSLVGERCIFGEHRKATLRAAEEGMTALGVDMALLDALEMPHGGSRELTPVYVELLSIITGEIVRRIAELEYNQIEITHRYRTNIAADKIANIISNLMNNSYEDDPNLNFLVYRSLAKHDPVMLSKCTGHDKYRIDTRKMYAHCVAGGNHRLIHLIAESILSLVDGEGSAAQLGREAEAPSFHHFSGLLWQKIAALYEGMAEAGVKGRKITEYGWRNHFALGDHLHVTLDELCGWLISEYGFAHLDLIVGLMIILKEASDYTAEINARIKKMILDLSQTRFAKELELASEAPDFNVAQYYHNTRPEEMISYFSSKILNVHLVEPYLKQLGAGATAGREGAASGTDAEDKQALLDSLFE